MNASFSTFHIAAALLWIGAIRFGADAIIAVADGQHVRAFVMGISALASVALGRDVWRAA